MRRRTCLGLLGAAVLNGANAAPIGLAIGNYGMKSMSAVEATQAVAKLGYDGIEYALTDGWPTSPKVLTASARAELRKLLGDLGLGLPSLMESLPAGVNVMGRVKNMDRLKAAAQLAHELSPAKPPLVQTILGLKPADWDTKKQAIIDELRDWARLAESEQMTFCFKPHAGNAIHSPEQAIEVVQAVASPRIRINYDYSHMAVEGRPLEESLRQLLPHAAYVQVKDAKGTPEKYEYLLPGDGNTDYVKYFRLLRELNYKGWVTVEISSMIHRKPDYDALSTARLCYQRMSEAFGKAAVSRPRKRQLSAQ
ncbi:MAG: sugar phosphate isomerase/epimerase [Acidobacteria bacterium]|nr:sugar phosphate isomerase/epimerase [Acidobacteriota bacterium]